MTPVTKLLTTSSRGVGGLTIFACVLATLACACVPRDEVASTNGVRESAQAAPAGEALRSVALPDLSRLAEAVQAQVRERYSSLMQKLEDRSTTAVELGNAYGELGLILMAAEYYDAAQSCYLNAHALAPDASRWAYYLGHLYRMRGEAAKAAEFFARALERQPTDLATLVWLGETSLDQGRPEAAERLFLQALSRDPRSAAALSGAGRAALATRDAARSIEYLERALSLEPRASSLHYQLAMAYRALGDGDKAEAHLQQRGDGQLTPPDPLMEEYARLLQSPLAYETRGMRALEDGQPATAAQIFREGLELTPNDPSLRHRLGTTLFMMGDSRGAVEQLEETLRRSPEFAKAHFGLGMILALSGRHREAAERFSAAVKHQPDYLEARLGLADALRTTGRVEESLPHYEQIVMSDPGFAEAWTGRALALVQLERFQEARDWLVAAQQVHPDRPELTDLLARLPR